MHGSAIACAYDEVELHDGTATVGPGLVYAAQAMVRGDAELRLTFRDGNDQPLGSATATRPDQGRWCGIAVSATAPESATSARLEITAESTAESTDVRLVCSGAIRTLGTPVHTSVVHSAIVGPWSDGTPVAYTVMRGRPARLTVLDARDGHAVAGVPFTNEPYYFGAFGIAQALDGTVYVAGSNGHLYRYSPGDDRVIDLDLSAGGTSMLWHVTVDDDGRVFSGTYPHGEVVRYDPRDGSVARTRVADGLKYTRSVAVADGVVWAGMGTPARLFRLDADSLEVIDEVALPDGLADDQPMVYDLGVVGPLLIARTSGDSSIHAFDRTSRTWSPRLGTGRGIGFTRGPNAEAFWLAPAGTLKRCGADQRVVDTGVRVPPPGVTDANPTGYGWDGTTLRFIDANALYSWDSTSGTVHTTSAELPSNQHRIHRIATAGDGRIYVTGFAPGGIATFDPSNGELREFPAESAKQAEYLLDHAGRIWLGTYPGADLLAFDPTRECVPGENPEPVASLKHLAEPAQDRPHAMAGTPLGLFVGTVPEYGQHGGKLFVLSPGSREPRLVELPATVAEHSITALAYDAPTNSVLVGTCLLGGLGLPPAGGAARLVRLALPDLNVVWDTTPDPAEPAITSLLAAPDGHVWGLTPGSVFTADLATGERTELADIAPFAGSNHAVWTSGKLVADTDGRIFAQHNGQLVVFDAGSPACWTVLATDTTHGIAPLFARDSFGSSYFARDSTLYQLSPPDREGAPT